MGTNVVLDRILSVVVTKRTATRNGDVSFMRSRGANSLAVPFTPGVDEMGARIDAGRVNIVTRCKIAHIDEV